MPLKSGIKNIGTNIGEMRRSGHPQKQAVAAAMHAAYGPKRAAGGFVGALTGDTEGRADKLSMDVPSGSHVIPADVVSALGGGNSQHGHRLLFGMFPGSKPGKAKKVQWPKSPLAKGTTFPKGPAAGLKMASGGKTVPVRLSDGEFIISPDDVAQIGAGDPEKGHRHLDDFILHIRRMFIDHLKTLPEPAK